MNTIVDDILAHYVGLTPYTIVALGNRGGLSGARLWRIHSSLGDFALKSWPPNTLPGRLRTIHQHMYAAHEMGLAFVPVVLPTRSGDTCNTHHGRVWDLTIWMPGAADFQDRPTIHRLRAACTTLAQLHLVWRNESPRVVCPGVERRLVYWRDWLAIVQSGFQPPDEARSRWLLVADLMTRVPSQLAEWTATTVSVQPCLCDIWHDHVLFTHDQVTGVIDYGAMKTDHVAVDLARLLGSMVPGDQRMIDMGLQAYRSVRDFSANEERLMYVLEETGAICAGANWLRWLYGAPRKFDDEQAVQRRLDAVFRRLEALDASP